MIIKIVSLNTWMGGHLLDEIVIFLRAQNADILVLQEMFNGQDASLAPRYRTVQIFKERLGYVYECFIQNHDQPDNTAPLGNAVISRFPIISNDSLSSFAGHEKGSGPTAHYGNLYNLQHVVLNTPVGELSVLNAHGPWDLDGDNFSPSRSEMSALITEVASNRENVILAGDMNARPTNRAIVAISKQLKAVFGDELVTTFNMKHKDNEGYATAAVDMIFVSPNIKIIEHDCPDVDISDHLPLVTTMSIDEV